MNAERLRQAIRVLENAAANAELRKHFDLSAWAVRKDQAGNILNGLPDGEEPLHQCGTSACAVGFCGIDAWFQQEGFKLSRSGSPQFTSHFAILVGWDAVEKFFGLTTTQAEWLFSGYKYPNERSSEIRPEQVIDRLQHMVRMAEVGMGERI
jgi:hypothetical protein